MNKQFRFAKKTIEALPAHVVKGKTKETEYTDTEVSGLKVMVNKVGRKTFYYRFIFKGKKKGMKIGDFPLMEVSEARQKCQEAKLLLSKGIDPTAQLAAKKQADDLTYSVFMREQYLPHAAVNKRSARTDESRFKNHLAARFGHLPLSEIKTYDIQQFHDLMKQKRRPATANRYLALLKRSLNVAVLWGLLDHSPVRGIRMHQENNLRKRYLQSNELYRLLEAIKQEANRTAAHAIALLLYTGVRRQEALSAQWVDIDLDKGVWLLPKTKAGKSRHVVLNKSALNLLLSMKPNAQSAFVFQGRKPNKPLCNPSKAFARILKYAGISDFRIHDLRHAYASLAISNGASLYEVQHLLGHASSQTTMRYAHLADDKLRQASANVSDAIEAAGCSVH